MKFQPLKHLSIHSLASMAAITAVSLSLSSVLAAPDPAVTATKEDIAAFCGTGNVKIVFINGNPATNDRFLYYVDWTTVASGLPAVTKITATSNAILPSISPDGQWIVYAVGPQYDGYGAVASSAYLSTFDAGASPVLVKANTAYQPRFIPNAAVQPTVIYTTEDGTNAHDGKGQTVKMACPGGLPSGTEDVVYAGGSYVGGLNWDETFLCSGYQEARMVGVGTNAAAESRQLHIVTFLNATDGRDTTITNQVCNPSPSPSRIFTNTMMYLDFGYMFITLDEWYHPYIGGGGYWKQHALFFIANYDNEVIKEFRAPANNEFMDTSSISSLIVWDDPEWSNHPYFATVNAHVNRRFSDPRKETMNREIVYIINLKDSTYLKVLETTDVSRTATTNLQWPWVWIEIPDGFQEEDVWLVDVEKPAAPVFRTKTAPVIIEEGILHSTVPIRKVATYNMLGGKRAEQRCVSPRTSIELNKMPGGIYFVQFEAIDGTRGVVRWTVSR